MAQLLYSAITSLDGYSADAGGDFSWGAPDEEVHAAINEQQRSIGTYLYGRRMYEIMRFWESEQAIADDDPIAADYGRIWRAADKVVYSATLAEASTQHTRIERSFQLTVVERLKREAVADLSIMRRDDRRGCLRGEPHRRGELLCDAHCRGRRTARSADRVSTTPGSSRTALIRQRSRVSALPSRMTPPSSARTPRST